MHKLQVNSDKWPQRTMRYTALFVSSSFRKTSSFAVSFVQRTQRWKPRVISIWMEWDEAKEFSELNLQHTPPIATQKKEQEITSKKTYIFCSRKREGIYIFWQEKSIYAPISQRYYPIPFPELFLMGRYCLQAEYHIALVGLIGGWPTIVLLVVL